MKIDLRTFLLGSVIVFLGTLGALAVAGLFVKDQVNQAKADLQNSNPFVSALLK